LLFIEQDRVDLVLNRLERFKRNFSKRLIAINEERVLVFLKLANSYYEKPNEAASEKFRERVENSFEWVGVAEEDIFVMSFYAWLKSKMEQRNLYETTLELIQSP